MWMWILIGLTIIAKANGYSHGTPTESCNSMAPVHMFNNGQLIAPQTTQPPFKVDYKHGKVGEPITVFLRSTQGKWFRGFMLEARKTDMVDQLVGQFIVLRSTVQLLTCNSLPDSAVSHANNQRKTEIQVNWTTQGAELEVTFRATFLESYDIFWEKVDVNVTLPQYTTSIPTSTTKLHTTASSTEPSTSTSTTKLSTTASTTEPSTTTRTTQLHTTASSTEPSTTTSTTKLSTTTSTTEPSATTSTTKLSTTASVTEPSTTTSTTKLSTTTSTTEPSATTSTTKLSTTASTTEPSTTTSTTKLSTTGSTTEPSPTNGTTVKIYLQGAVILNAYHSVLAIVTLEMFNIATITNSLSLSVRHLNKVSNILCCVLCVVAEISALVLLCLDSFNVILIALVCVVIVIDLIKLVIVSVPIGPSHELKEILDITLKVCSVISEIFKIAVIFTGVLEIETYRTSRTESWLLKLMVAYTVWILLFVIWVFIYSTYIKGILWSRKLGSSKTNCAGWRKQRQKKKLSEAEAMVIAVSVIHIFGTTCFAVAVSVGIFSG